MLAETQMPFSFPSGPLKVVFLIPGNGCSSFVVVISEDIVRVWIPSVTREPIHDYLSNRKQVSYSVSMSEE